MLRFKIGQKVKFGGCAEGHKCTKSCSATCCGHHGSLIDSRGLVSGIITKIELFDDKDGYVVRLSNGNSVGVQDVCIIDDKFEQHKQRLLNV